MRSLKEGDFQQLQDDLERALKSARMEGASFDSIGISDDDLSLPKAEKEVTRFIKGRTASYRNSWLIGPLERALEVLGKA